jgi:hypothetical protein
MFVVLLLTLHLSAGVSVLDSSIPVGQANRRFRCRACLLFWTGDYPGIAKASGTHDKCCHWCTQKSTWTPEVKRRCWGDFRRFLPNHPVPHPLREASGQFGPAETREPYPARTSGSMVQQGLSNVAHEGLLRRPDARKNKIYIKDLPFKTHGVKAPCPLRFLPFFDVVWDFMPDMMHLNSGIWQRHFFELLKGKRMPAAVTKTKNRDHKQNAQLLQDHESVKRLLADWALTKVREKHSCFLLVRMFFISVHVSLLVRMFFISVHVSLLVRMFFISAYVLYYSPCIRCKVPQWMQGRWHCPVSHPGSVAASWPSRTAAR